MWDYRVFRKKEEKGDHTFYLVYEVYYDETGAIESISEEPVSLYGDTLINLLSEVKKYCRAFTLPILDWVEVDATIYLSNSNQSNNIKSVTGGDEKNTSNSGFSKPVKMSSVYYSPVEASEENPLQENIRKHAEILEAKRLESESLHEKLLLGADESVIFDFLKNLPVNKRIH